MKNVLKEPFIDRGTHNVAKASACVGRRAFAPLASSPDAYKRREALTNQITKLAAQYDKMNDEEEKEKILNQIEDLKTQRDAPYKEE